MMVARHLSAQRNSAGGTLEEALPTMLIDEPVMFSSEREEPRIGLPDEMLGINQQVAWIEGTLHVSF